MNAPLTTDGVWI